jgi:inorganic pyrophosphatase
MMRFFITALLLIAAVSCTNDTPDHAYSQDFLLGYPATTPDSLVNIVVEIPAGTNEKWEVDKADGSLQWQRISADSMRMVAYLPYPANYGMVPQTLLPKELGGDGDPLDVFLLGPSLERGTVMPARIIGIIIMRDQGEQDDKLIAVAKDHWFGHIISLQQLEEEYPGVVAILSAWLTNYKQGNRVQVISVGDAHEANKLVRAAIEAFQSEPSRHLKSEKSQ